MENKRTIEDVEKDIKKTNKGLKNAHRKYMECTAKLIKLKEEKERMMRRERIKKSLKTKQV